jgi:hypothetical protein
MSETESNVCETCGGVKRVDWTISFEECHPVEMRFDPASLAENWRLCPGHPEPAQKHEGPILLSAHFQGLDPEDEVKSAYSSLICEVQHVGNIYRGTLYCDHHEPGQKHDGKISDFYEARYLQQSVFIGNGGHLNDHLELEPSQALSLRDWLIQETPALEKLAKEAGE